ncbi:sulfotransferase domain-containing protein [Tropicimonas aquimaris]|uniref:Sulfotransferase domain-containing protein n=1 Tax=Tropicimonas aquimaris TaxID=914152 RepID=A0ABW3IXQ6_9RHOB
MTRQTSSGPFSERIIEMRKLAVLSSRISSVVLRNWLRSDQRRAGNFVVLGFPKSGTTWVSQIIAEACGFDYRRDRVRVQLSNVLLHTHSINFVGTSNLIYVVRDPREAICSAARAIPPDRRSEAFDANGKIRFDFVVMAIERLPGATTSYVNHLTTCQEKGWRFVRFEDLKMDTVGTMAKVIALGDRPVEQEQVTEAVNKFDFNMLKKESNGDRFLAQSSLASWQDLLSQEALELVAERLAEPAAAFGYDLEPVA